MSDIKRAPTAAEERAQAHESIVAGVRGMMFYEYYQAKRAKVWQYIAKIAVELGELEPVLVDPNPVRRAECDGPVETWLKRHKGHDYLITVSRSEDPVKAKVTIPGASDLDLVEVLFENRRVRAEGPSFVDEFEPYGVHVYRIRLDAAIE